VNSTQIRTQSHPVLKVSILMFKTRPRLRSFSPWLPHTARIQVHIQVSHQHLTSVVGEKTKMGQYIVRTMQAFGSWLHAHAGLPDNSRQIFLVHMEDYMRRNYSSLGRTGTTSIMSCAVTTQCIAA
jgi:hypothetical protein